MKQYICDRCGVVIPSDKFYHNHIIFYDSDVPYKYGIEFQGDKSYSECDLCDDCLERLHNMNQAFMENYELVVKE